MRKDDDQMRILQVFATLDRGGAETLMMNVYRAIDREKVQFDFAVNESNHEYSYEHEIKELGGRVFRIPRYSFSNHFAYRKFWKSFLIEHSEWRVLHIHHTTPAFSYLDIAKSLRRVCIAHSHIAGKERSLKSTAKWLMRLPLRYKADVLFGCSEKASKWMFGKRYKRAILFKNAIEPSKYRFDAVERDRIRFELGITNRFVIGHIGRFVKQKNHDFLVKLFKHLRNSRTDSILLLVGDGELQKDVATLSNELGVRDSVIFTGVRSDVAALLSAMDVFVMPSLFEGLPVTAIEAQANGLKCIFSDNITKEVEITENILWLSLKSGPAFWADKILKIGEQYPRDGYADSISEAGYDIAENASMIEKLYLDLLMDITTSR